VKAVADAPEEAAAEGAEQESPMVRQLLRYPSALLLGAIALLIVVLPFVEELEGADMVEPVLLSLVLGAASIAVGERSSVKWWAGLLVAPALIGTWVHHFFPSDAAHLVSVAAGLVFVAIVVQRLLRYVVRSGRIDSEVLCAGVSTFLLLGVLWAFAYVLAEGLSPGSFVFTGPAAGKSMTGFTAMYFSLVTLTTVGFGEILPATGIARMLAATEAVAGVLCIAVLMARLVGGYAPGGRGDPPVAPSDGDRSG
jgi:hypothetical protein